MKLNTIRKSRKQDLISAVVGTVPKYSEIQFLDISEKVLTKLSPSITKYIGAKVYENNGDTRDVIRT